MRFSSVLRAGALALAVVATGASFAPAFADESLAAQSQVQQNGSTGPYDGLDYQAARSQYNN